METRPLPSDLGIENAVIGSLIIDYNSCIGIEKISSEIFYNEKNKQIFETIKSLQVVDLLTVTDKLPNLRFEIIEKTSNLGSVIHFDHHVKILTDLYLRRRFIENFYKLTQNAYDFDIADIVQSAENQIFEIDKFINDFITSKGVRTIAQIEQELLCRSDASFAFQSEILHCNLNFGQNVVVAARQGTGKTSYMTFLAKEALRAGFEVFYVAVEGDLASYVRDFKTEKKEKIWFLNKNLTIDNIVLQIKKNPAKIVIVDYLQRIFTDKQQTE
jgi:replicative DNA helicase